MSAVVLIAMHEDEARMRKVVAALLHEQVDIWWERPEAGEGGWERSVKTVMDAHAVVFFWSAASTGENGAAYRELAKRALAADKAISVRLEKVKIPDEFHSSTVIDLSSWQHNAKDVFLLDLAYTAKAKAAGLDPPPLRGPARVMLRRVMIAAPTVLFAIGLFITFKSLYSTGLENIASPAERHDWAARHIGSCADLRMFLIAHPNGVHSDLAKTMLSARREWTERSWQPAHMSFPLYVTRGAAGTRPNEAQARAFAQSRAATEAKTICQGFAQTGAVRFLAATVNVREWKCEPLADGTVCSIDGTAECGLQEPVSTTREQCGPAPAKGKT
jgi:hypothetical protein